MIFSSCLKIFSIFSDTIFFRASVRSRCKPEIIKLLFIYVLCVVQLNGIDALQHLATTTKRRIPDFTNFVSTFLQTSNVLKDLTYGRTCSNQVDDD